MEKAGEELRPDKCHMLFEKWSDAIMVGITDIGIEDIVFRQIAAFNKENISVLIIDHRLKEKTYFLSPLHTVDFVKEEINRSGKGKI